MAIGTAGPDSDEPAKKTKKKPKSAAKKKSKPVKKFIAMYAANGVDYNIDHFKTHNTLQAALEDLQDFVDYAEDRKAQGEDPEFRIYAAVEVPLRIQKKVRASIKVGLA